MARQSDQIWKVLSHDTPPTPPQRREGIRVYRPDETWTSGSNDIKLPAISNVFQSASPNELPRLSPAANFLLPDKQALQAYRSIDNSQQNSQASPGQVVCCVVSTGLCEKRGSLCAQPDATLRAAPRFLALH